VATSRVGLHEHLLALVGSGAPLGTAVAGAAIGLWERRRADERKWLDDWCQRMDVDPCEGPAFDDRWCRQIHPSDVARYRARQTATADVVGSPYVIDYRVRTRGGEWRWLQEGCIATRSDADRQSLMQIGVCIDIDASKHAELERNQAAERYRALARLVRGYVFEGRLMPTGQLEFTWADDEFGVIFGCERAEVNRLGWQTFVDPRDRQAAAERVAGLAQGKMAEMELRIVSRTGERRWLRLAADALPDPVADSTLAVVGMAEDITNRKALIEHMFDVIHNEQQRIGADLHDGLGQVLTGVSLMLRSCHTHAMRGDVVAPGEFEQLIELVTGAIETTRGLAHGLAPGTREFGGLLFALNALAQQSRRVGLPIDLIAPAGYNPALDPTVSDHVYRIVQEAVTNAARHARAEHLVINVTASSDVLTIEVIDDGVGLSEDGKPGFGINSMRYRADVIGARLAVGAVAPRGTRVLLRLPLGSP
jgi:PAS domain S-box-containing protein